MKYTTFIGRIKSFFTKKRIIWSIVILFVLFLGWLIFGRKSTSANIQVGTVKRQDILKTVLTTGQVVSETDLDLSFQASGVVRRINVKEGDHVQAGAVLAVLDQGSARANLESAQGSFAQAKANYDKILAAATTQDIAVTEAALNTAKTSLENARQNLKNELQTAYTNTNTSVLAYTNILFSNSQSSTPQFSIPGTVNTNPELLSLINSERVTVNTTLTDWPNKISGLTDTNLDAAVTVSLANLDLVSKYFSDIINILATYTQVTSGGSQTTITTYQSNVSTAKSTVDSLRSSIVADNQALNTAKASLAQAEATLNLKKAPPRPEDLSIAEAQVMSAQGSLDSAQAALNNTVIVSPISGIVTQVDIKLGEQAQATKEVIKVLNASELHTEAQVSEADIASVQVGQSIDYTFDALDPDEHFTNKVLTVNPASNIVSGVVNYKVTGGLENIKQVKPGMTANMTILVSEKKNVLVVPSSSIINKSGKKLVKVIDDPKKKTYHEVEVSTGLEADGGVVEILGGLSENQSIVTYMK